jgi:hypothetical protein
MGYRSEVAIALTDDATRLLKAIEEHEVFDDLLTSAEGSYPKHLDPEVDNWCKLFWGDIKWREDWPEIAAFHEFIAGLPEEDYLFVRSGEDLEDNTFDGQFYDSEIYISKSLQWN